MRKISSLGILVLFLVGQVTHSLRAAAPLDDHAHPGPTAVYIIRHAEKPEKTDADKDPNLSPRGYQRADALAHLIPKHFLRPDFIIATKKSSRSNRPIETIQPLAKAMHLQIESTFNDDEFAELAHSILTDPKYAGKSVLIAWHHGKIPELAHALGAVDAPATWDSTVFDRVWKITFDKGTVTWTDLPQHALPGDSDK